MNTNIPTVHIHNGDCRILMANLPPKSVDVILTSPPYNMTKRKGGNADSGRYDMYNDWKPESEYIYWTINLFDQFDAILNTDGVVLYNFGYSIENPALPYKLVASIVDNTNFTLIDTVFWKKTTGMPFPANGKRLSRIVEFVWVFVRKSEVNTYKNGRTVVKTSPSGQKYYNVVYNLLEAKNSDMKTPLNQATFSQEFVGKLLDIYASQETKLIYDPFSGIGTTLIASVKRGYNCIGSELSDKQCELAKTRLCTECIADVKTILSS